MSERIDDIIIEDNREFNKQENIKMNKHCKLF